MDIRFTVTVAIGLLLTACSHGHVSFLDPQGPVASMQRTHFLEMVALLAVFVAAPIFLLVPWFAWRYRYANKASRYAPGWKFYRPLEIAAWSGPVVIVALLAVLVWRSTHALDPYKPLVSDQPPLRVQVIGYDWKWLFVYPDQGIASVGTLAMPADRPVSMQITSATVMQSLFVPALGSQIYAMGGMVTQLNLQADKPGRFLGENTMYNGNGFHQQQFTATAMTPDQFKAWVSKLRSQAIPLSASALQALSRRGTRAQLAAALGKDTAAASGLYFRDVPTDLFARVVSTTRQGTALQGAQATPHSAVNAGAAGSASTKPVHKEAR